MFGRNKNAKAQPRTGLNVQKLPDPRATKDPTKKKVERQAKDRGHELDGVQKIKPPDQLMLTESELEEKITRVLTTHSPYAPQNIIRFNYKQGAYQQIDVTHTANIFEMESNIVQKASQEDQRLMLNQENVATNTRAATEDRIKTQATPLEDDEEAEESEKVDRPDYFAPDKNIQKLGNYASLISSATQTLNNTSRDVGCQTKPCRTFSAAVNQGQIYDAYCEELQKQEKQKATLSENKNDKSKKGLVVTKTQSCDLTKVAKSTQILEQMIHQNLFDDIAQDFKFFVDPSDKFRVQQGTLLPLWTFQFEEAKGLTVTALCWNNKQPDIFAVGLGSYNFDEQGGGMILLYSLKNTFSPQYFCPTTSGVLCLDIHQQHFNLVAVGFYDGCVAVYDMKKKSLNPVCKGTPKNSLSITSVWQVCWQKDDIDHNHNFFSVSSDSRVVSWTMIRDELISVVMIRLSVKNEFCYVPDDEQLLNIPVGTTLSFHKQVDHLFLAGTDQGKIHECSKHYSCKFLETYDAHSLAVGTVKWNHFHPRVFISCSFDWTVKIWDSNIKVPLLTLNLKSEVGDVAWAPYSSTVFAAVTVNGLVHVFDLSINKYEAICKQVIVAKQKATLTHIEFNPVHPIIIVGDNQGVISTFKLSPNLRKMPKDKWGREMSDPEAEIAKMEQVQKCLCGII